ncbi:MAG TPA: phosphopentomutase [candidate division Zixibacteria bacterium]|nr:phosphopentomutase [candidate division Zixibacteria bacterium]
MKKAIIIILDGVGIAEAPDAHEYNDLGSATLPHTAAAVGGLELPNMGRLGLGNLADIPGTPPTEIVEGAFARMFPKSKGKDSTTGHWELAGLVTHRPFPVFPYGFPPEIISTFEAKIGRGTLGNVVASGTEIIEKLGAEHLATAKPIVYTSADSVFQIAAHEDIVPVGLLYDWCRFARKILSGDFAVSRVIARPFVGSEGNFLRTPKRRDFSLEPNGPTLLTLVERAGLPVVGVGKIMDLFAGVGVTEPVFTHSNSEGIAETKQLIAEFDRGLIFTNLVDFDMLWGHRNDPRGLAQGLREFDDALPSIMAAMGDDDLLFITADHGNDPTTPSTDHSRELVPLLAWGRRIISGRIPDRASFADLGQTIAEFLGTGPTRDGESFFSEILA